MQKEAGIFKCLSRHHFEESSSCFRARLPPLPACDPAGALLLTYSSLWGRAGRGESKKQLFSESQSSLDFSIKNTNRKIRRRSLAFLEATSAAATEKLSSTVIKMDVSAHSVFSLQTEGLSHFGLYSLQGWVATNSGSFVQMIC